MHGLLLSAVLIPILAGLGTRCASAWQADLPLFQWRVTHTSSPVSGQSDEGHGGILYGKGYAFILSAPAGWVFDDRSGRAQGLNVVFYRQGESWATGQVVMYANVAYKEKGKDDTLDKVIKFDIGRMKERKAKLDSATASSLKLADGRSAIVYDFAFSGADDDASREKVVYVDTPKVVVMLVLTARSEAAYNKAVPDFERLVRSFQFMTDTVQIKPAKPGQVKGAKARQ